MKKLKFITLFTLAIFLSGCATNINSDVYSVEGVGVVNKAEAGTILSFRPVKVDGTNNAGGLVGGLAGGIAGSVLGGNNRVHALGALAGAVIGALIGSFVEKGITEQNAVEYVIKTDDGDTVTLVQPEKPSFAIGQRVLVSFGKNARILPYSENAIPSEKQEIPDTEPHPETQK